MYSSAKAFAIADSINSGVHLVVLAGKDDAAACVNDLYNIKGDEHVYFFPPSDVRTVKGTMKDMSAKVQRTAAVSALEDYSDGRYKGDYLIIVGYKESVEENIPDRNQIEDAVLRVSKGAAFPFEKLQDDLYGMGFSRVDFVSRPGEYAVRGGIIDVFSYSNDRPYRLDFFGDEIETIRMFDVNTQHTVGEELDILNIYPSMTEESKDGKETHGGGHPIYASLPEDSVIWISGLEDFREEGIQGQEHRQVYLSPLHSRTDVVQRIEFFDFLDDFLRTGYAPNFVFKGVVSNRVVKRVVCECGTPALSILICQHQSTELPCCTYFVKCTRATTYCNYDLTVTDD